MKILPLLLASLFSASVFLSSTVSAGSVNGTYKFRSGSGEIDLGAGQQYTFDTNDLREYAAVISGRAKIKNKSLRTHISGLQEVLLNVPGAESATVTGPSEIRLKKQGKNKWVGTGAFSIKLKGKYSVIPYEADGVIVLRAKVKNDKLTLKAPLYGNMTQPAARPISGNAQIKLKKD